MIKLMLTLFILAILIIRLRASIEEKHTNYNHLPSKLQITSMETFLAGLITTSLDGPPKCDVCSTVAESIVMPSCVHSSNCSEEPSELIKLHCLKANSSKFFVLNSSDSKINILEQFNSKLPFAFLVHGFSDFFPGVYPIKDRGWMEQTLLDWSNIGVNICAVNWGSLSKEVHNYFVVSQINADHVVKHLLKILLRLEALGVNMMETTLVGHGLGGHIVGKTGALMKNRTKIIGNIFGLDPAGPCFTFPCLVDDTLRLDESDANFVQCIHTNIGVLGQVPRCGCQDFYLNLGFALPGAINTLIGHFFACTVFDWTLFKDNKCKASFGDQFIGIHHNQSKCGVYELSTKNKEPYCM